MKKDWQARLEAISQMDRELWKEGTVFAGLDEAGNLGYEYGSWEQIEFDEEGNDIELEYIDALEHNGTTYMAFFPVVEEGEEENEDEYGLIILKSETVDGEEMLANVVDEDEINEVYDLFMEQMMEDEEE